MIVILTSVLVLQLQSSLAASSEEEARFVAAVKQAFEKGDVDSLMSLTCWDRVPDKFKVRAKMHYARDIARTVTDVTLMNPDPKIRDIVWKDTNGVYYCSNLPVIKHLKITYAPGGQLKEGTYPVGEKDGKLYLLQQAPVK